MKRALIVAAVGLLGVAAVAVASTGGANATPNEKVTICHATSSETNPYTVNRVDRSSVDEQNNYEFNGHGDHERDIIPPFEVSGDLPDFPGKNWDAEGQAIWENGCVVPPPTAIEVTPDEPTLVGPTCDAPGEVMLPTVTGVEYTKTVRDNGSVKVTAEATSGYVLAPDSTTKWIYTARQLAQLSPDDPQCSTEPPPVEVTPPAPTLVDPTCDAPGEVMLPTDVTGVEYTKTVRDNGSVKVTAEATSGYVLAPGSTTEWIYTARQLAQLSPDDPQCVKSFPPTVPPLMPATPDDPELIAPTCDAPGDIELPTVTGVVYTETVQPDGDVVVTAAAANGYVLTAGSTTMWNYSAMQLAQLPDDDPLCVASLPPTVPPVEPTPDEPTAPVPTPGEPTVASAPPTPGAAAPEAVGAAPATTLPATGGETWAILAVGMVSLISGAWLYRLSRRAA